MSEPRIAVKIIGNRFVSVFPMPDPRPDEHTFFQSLMSSNAARSVRHRMNAIEDVNWCTYTDYARTKEDQSQ